VKFSLIVTVAGAIGSHPDNFNLHCNVVLMEFWYLISLFLSKKVRKKKEKIQGNRARKRSRNITTSVCSNSFSPW